MPDIQPDSILIATVTKVEAQAVLGTFSESAGKEWTRRPIGNKTYYNLGVHGGVPVFMVQSEMGAATPGGSLSTVRQAIQDLQPQAIIMCGIAFGLCPDKQQLGDILVSKQIQYYEPQKIDVLQGQMSRGDRSMASERLLDRFRSGDIDWQGTPTHFGLVLSGEKLVNDPAFRDGLLKNEPEAIGGEMEGAGLYTAAREAKVDWILVKAICDWAGGDKNDYAQPLAAKNAAQFVLHVLQRGGWGRFEQGESPTISIVTYSVFISSPGDVMKERETVHRIIDEINRHFRTMKDWIGVRVILDLLTWEKDTFPDAGLTQSTIQRQIPYDKCDIFISIFWKRFGTPPGTARPQDGKLYLSGTQQEIEEAMAHREKEGSPVIMLYRKDEPVSTSQSPEEIEQLHRVANFFRECEPGGSHPSLVIPFKSESFGDVLRDHLLKAVTHLQQSSSGANGLQTVQPESSSGKPDHHLGAAIPQLGDAIEENLNRWLRQVKLWKYPFPSLRAESDRELPKYFARFQRIRAMTRAEIFEDRRSRIFFGRLGFGKTALRKLFVSWGNPNNPKGDILCLEFGKDDIQGILSEVDQISDFANHFLLIVHRRVIDRQQMYQLPAPDWQPTDDLAGSLAGLSQALQSCGLDRVMCLIDPDLDDYICKKFPISPVKLVTQLLQLPSASGIGFCYFLPSELEKTLNDTRITGLLFDYRVTHIRWTVDDLRGLISRRMITCSSNQLSPYRSLGQLCEDERDFASLVDRKIVTLAEGSPRGAISLANHLIELHIQDYPQHPQIASKTWDEVEMDWWWERRGTILGTPGRRLWVRGDHIFYGNRKLILADTSQRLLRCLVLGQEYFASKDDLKQAGWPEDRPQGISDAALREAMRRMRKELKAEFETNTLGAPPSVKSVRGRGYRLENVSPNGTGGEKW